MRSEVCRVRSAERSMGRSIISLLLLLVASSVAAAPAKTIKPPPTQKHLYELNALTTVLVPRDEIVAGELARLVDLAEAVAVRDGLRGPSPSAITYAGSVERSLGSLKGERAVRVLLELSLVLATFGGPGAESLTEEFFPMLLYATGVAVKDAKPRPALRAELAEIGAWAATMVERELGKLPPDERAVGAVRLAFARGHYGDAQTLARQALAQSAQQLDPRWHGWMAASLVLGDKRKEAAPFIAAAQASGGEAARILLRAERQRAVNTATERATRALRSLGLAIVSVESGGKGKSLFDACRLLVTGDPERFTNHAARGEAAAGCAAILTEATDAAWLDKAMPLLPVGVAGAPARAAGLLRGLFAAKAQDRPRLLASYLTEIRTLSVEPTDRRLLLLLGYLGASPRPVDWAPDSAEERTLLNELEEKATCEASTFPMRAVAARRDRGSVYRFVGSIVTRCASRPEGLSISVDALTLLVQLLWEDPSPVEAPATVEQAVADFARAHTADAQVNALQGDLVATRALAAEPPSLFGMQAALSRYEDAIAHTSSQANVLFRQRLESNAAYLSLALASVEKDSERRGKLLARAGGHLRIAVSLGDSLPVLAVRARYDLDSKSGTPLRSQDLARLPPSAARSRLACLAAKLAETRRDPAAQKQLVALAADRPADERKLKLPSLLVDTSAKFSVSIDDRVLRPLIELPTSLFLVPPCE